MQYVSYERVWLVQSESDRPAVLESADMAIDWESSLYLEPQAFIDWQAK
jgi:hypothetical protein